MNFDGCQDELKELVAKYEKEVREDERMKTIEAIEDVAKKEMTNFPNSAPCLTIVISRLESMKNQ